MVRSFAVLAFIGSVAAAAILVSQRPTIARGDVIAADLMRSNAATLETLDCDPQIPIGIDGARFWCRAEFKLGAVKRLEFKMDRAGGIKQLSERELGSADPARSSPPPPSPPRSRSIDKTDPWSN